MYLINVCSINNMSHDIVVDSTGEASGEICKITSYKLDYDGNSSYFSKSENKMYVYKCNKN